MNLLIGQPIFIFLEEAFNNSFSQEGHPIANVICENSWETSEEQVWNGISRCFMTHDPEESNLRIWLVQLEAISISRER